MEILADPVFKTQYQKYKNRVKLWESHFTAKHGRKPNKVLHFIFINRDIKLIQLELFSRYQALMIIPLFYVVIEMIAFSQSFSGIRILLSYIISIFYTILQFYMVLYELYDFFTIRFERLSLSFLFDVSLGTFMDIHNVDI